MKVPKSGKTRPGHSLRKRISVEAQEARDSPEGWKEAKKRKVGGGAAAKPKGNLKDYKAKYETICVAPS